MESSITTYRWPGPETCKGLWYLKYAMDAEAPSRTSARIFVVGMIINDFLLCLALRVAGQFEPPAMINVGHSHQYNAKRYKAQDPIALVQIAGIKHKDFENGYRHQQDRLPAHESRALPEAKQHQSCAVHKPDHVIAQVLGELNLLIAHVAGWSVMSCVPLSKLPAKVAVSLQREGPKRQQVQDDPGNA